MRLKITTNKLLCKYCHSPRIVKYGSYNNSQYWLCRDCNKKFTDNDAVIHGKLPSQCVTYALGAYYDGMSINAIRRNLKQQYNIEPSSSTIFDWINKYTKELIDKTKDLKPEVGSIWIADESYIRIDRQKKNDNNNFVNPYDKNRKAKWAIFWDIIDADSRFLIASLVTTTRWIFRSLRAISPVCESHPLGEFEPPYRGLSHLRSLPMAQSSVLGFYPFLLAH